MEETFLEKRFVTGNVLWQKTFCVKNVLCKKTFCDRKCLWQETFVTGNVCDRKRFWQETFIDRKNVVSRNVFFLTGNGFWQETFCDRKRCVRNILCSVGLHKVEISAQPTFGHIFGNKSVTISPIITSIIMIPQILHVEWQEKRAQGWKITVILNRRI